MTIKELNENTSVPFKVMVPICTLIVTGSLWINNTLARMERGMNAAWPEQAMQDWSQELRLRNHELDVPYPSDFLRRREQLQAEHRPR